MVTGQTKQFLKLYYRPLSAMSGIIDEGSWVFGAVAVVAISMLLQFSITSRIYAGFESVPAPVEQQEPPAELGAATGDLASWAEQADDEEWGFERKPLPIAGNFAWHFISFAPMNVFASVVTLALIYVPLILLVIVMFEPQGSFGLVLQRDYGPLLACALMGWAASHLPFALAGLALDEASGQAAIALALWAVAKVFFAILMVCALRRVFGAKFVTATGAVCLSWVSVALESYVVSSRVVWYLASPCILIFAMSFLRGNLGDFGYSFRNRQRFRHNLEAATINPRDAEAHYQMGLLYQQRRQYSEAIIRFRRAIEISPREVEAQFQLGRIAREQGRLQEAIDYFNTVVTEDDKHSQNEVWREIGRPVWPPQCSRTRARR
jgi:Tetratricopeptide repeat